MVIVEPPPRSGTSARRLEERELSPRRGNTGPPRCRAGWARSPARRAAITPPPPLSGRRAPAHRRRAPPDILPAFAGGGCAHLGRPVGAEVALHQHAIGRSAARFGREHPVQAGMKHSSTDAAASRPPRARPRPGRPRRELLARRNAPPVRGTCERSEGSGAVPNARRFWSGWRRERRRWRVPICRRASDRPGGNRPRVASFASFAERVHVHSARRATAARTGRARRRVRSLRAKRLVPLSPSGAIQVARCAGRCP